MKLELQSAANFLVHLLRLGRHNIPDSQLDQFRIAVVETLRRRYRDHWFPEKPFKGSGYRCIRINGKIDPIVAQAAESCGLNSNLIHQIFPSELTMWVDPLEVSYRIGEDGSICVLYERPSNDSSSAANEPWQPSSVSISASSATVDNKKSSSSLSSSSSSESSMSQPSSPTHFHRNQHHRVNGNNGNSNNYVINKNNLNNKHLSAVNAAPSSHFNKSTTATDCKDSLFKLDCLLDPRKSVSIEQLAAYVSS